MDYLDTSKLHYGNLMIMMDQDHDDDERQLIGLAFSKKKANARKEWLSQFFPGTYIDQSGDSITYTDFINNELIHFSMANNICSIPSMVDGFEPDQHKVVYDCFLQPDVEVKIVMLTSSIIEKVAYHHVAQILASTIIGLALNFAGPTTSICLSSLASLALAPRVVRTQAPHVTSASASSPSLNCCSTKYDMSLLNYLDDDEIKVEPERFVPVVLVVLLNGCDGISTRWFTNIPNSSPVDVISNLWQLMHNESPISMLPCRITKLDDWHLKITELPIRVCTQAYDAMMEYWRLNSNMVSEASMTKLEKGDLYAKFKLTDSILTSNLVCFDKSGRIKRYASAEEIMTEFYNIHLQFYHKRKEDLVSKLIQDYTKLSNQNRFILTIINKELEMRNVTHADLIKQLIEMAFDLIKTKDDGGATNNGFKYLLGMKMISMIHELVEKLIRVCDAKFEGIEVLCAKSPPDLWNADFNLFLKLWEEMVEKIQLTFSQSLTKGTICSNKKGWRVASKPKLKKKNKETKHKALLTLTAPPSQLL
ncbi:DNA topoisomerase 2 [Massospora cicadina]|nr:DNA topoisomerase 2 [Massospora cicadina]